MTPQHPPAGASSRPSVAARRWILVTAAVLAVAFGAYVAKSLVGGSARDSGALMAVSLPDLEGRQQAINQWKGKLLIVNFWATWCAPCREEMPMFVDAQSAHAARGLQFVGIAVDDAAKVKRFATEIGMNYPALIGGYGAMELSRTLGNQLMALPFTIVVARDGTVMLTHLGPIKREQLDRILAEGLGP